MKALEKGYEFPRVEFELAPQWVEEYVAAVEDGAAAWLGADAVPPMAVAAQAVRCLLGAMSLPPGAIHAGQELEFLRPLHGRQQLAVRAQVANRSVRQGWGIVAIDLTVEDEVSSAVMRGRSTLMVPAE